MDSYRLEQLRASDNGHFGTILIVDDEPTYSYALVEILRTDGYKVQLVTSGDEALDVMNELSPDLLLVDIVMPAMNGKTLISELRSTSAWADLPIIVVSARTMPEDRASAFAGGSCIRIRSGSGLFPAQTIFAARFASRHPATRPSHVSHHLHLHGHTKRRLIDAFS